MSWGFLTGICICCVHLNHSIQNPYTISFESHTLNGQHIWNSEFSFLKNIYTLLRIEIFFFKCNPSLALLLNNRCNIINSIYWTLHLHKSAKLPTPVCSVYSSSHWLVTFWWPICRKGNAMQNTENTEKGTCF